MTPKCLLSVFLTMQKQEVIDMFHVKTIEKTKTGEYIPHDQGYRDSLIYALEDASFLLHGKNIEEVQIKDITSLRILHMRSS